ncbi:PilW family protein [Glaciecola sp. XM2]|jgi:type IV pilus assembly protein PilW|uniref:PilW family protein n=1 Tax=Glaciecola sp. XM2 TaxID=1914931 RepID=UPI0020328499|nr:PilW family protein [Glaciecola sp. XM2]
MKREKGFTLIEIMISLALGLIISGAVIQILVSNSVTDKLNKAVASAQESGRFIVSRMRQELMMVGLYDVLDPNISDLGGLIDLAEEELFLQTHPVPVPGDFVARAALGAQEGGGAANSDRLVVSLQGIRDCRGYDLGYNTVANPDQIFYVVNEYFLEGDELKCRGFDGRFLRGQKAAEGHNGHAAFTILDNVLNFQVLYGITDANAVDERSRPVRYIEADGLAAAYAANSQVVALRIALVIKGEGEVNLEQAETFKLLNEDTITAPDTGLYKEFETTITLRNMSNFVRGSA